MKPITVLMVATLLAACGAEGLPIRPIANLGLSVGDDGQVVRNCQVGGANATVQINVNC